MLEVGVANGFSSALIFNAANHFNKEIKVTLIDRPIFFQDLKWHRKFLLKNGITKTDKSITNMKSLSPGGIIPDCQFSGWLIEQSERDTVNHAFIIGNVFNIIPNLEKKYNLILIDAMKNETLRERLLNLVYEKCTIDSIIILDGYWVNNAFQDFCNKYDLTMYTYGNVAFCLITK